MCSGKLQEQNKDGDGVGDDDESNGGLAAPDDSSELIGLWRKWKVGFYGEVSTFVRTIQATCQPANYF